MFPNDIIRLIAKKCDLKTQVRCRLLNKRWYSALDDVYLTPIEIEIYDVETENYSYDIETEIERLDKNLNIDSFGLTDIKEVYFQDSPGYNQYILGKTKDLYFFLDEEFAATPDYYAWAKREVYFSKSLTKLIKFGMTQYSRRRFLKNQN